MSEEMEKLMEVIEQRILVHLNSRERVRECTVELIARIGKAYAEGLELPGEEWRAQAWIEDGHDAFPRGRVEVRPPIGALKGFPRQQAFDVIALDPGEEA